MAQNGFHLALLDYEAAASALRPAINENGMRYIDNYLWQEISTGCHEDFSNGATCSRDREQKVLGAIRKHLADTANDTALIGYWILDDYPGADIRPLLEKVHALVISANQASGTARAAICGFGGSLDSKSWGINHDFAPDRAVGFMRFVVNFDPKACDIVALYPYATGRVSNHSDIDWSMRGILPRMLQALRARGWDQQRQPLIGIPQTFGGRRRDAPWLYYVVPDAADVATQSAAYCSAGAIALLAFTWHSAKSGERAEMVNSPDLVDGLQRGAERCRTYWSH
jgi:hypothetical protein